MDLILVMPLGSSANIGEERERHAGQSLDDWILPVSPGCPTCKGHMSCRLKTCLTRTSTPCL